MDNKKDIFDKLMALPVKVVAQIVVIVMSYVISKWFIFKKEK